MSANGNQTNINQDRAFYLSTIPTDVIHSTIQVQELDAAVGRFSTLFSDQGFFSSLNVSTLNFQNSDVSGMYVSSIRGNTAFFSTVTLASDLSGGVGYVRFSVDASGIQVDGDPIRFDNLVYLTSSINIVQVSTIVDTDIFASNGYFSTLSSGILQFDQGLFSSLQGGNGSFSSLVVSSLAATDLSGDFAKNWSQYQTLNSSIIFQPAYILSNVSNKLFFAGQELTDASGGGNNWSAFPALQDVSMNNFSLRAISTLQFQDNATLTSVTGNNLFYNGQPIQFGNASNVSQWANYTAVNNVNMNTSSITNAGNIGAVNLALSGSNITNGNTFTNSLGVGGTSLVSLASINSLGQLSCQDIDVGSALTGLADVNIYGATAVPGDSALYVEGGVQFNGGTVHGFSAGVIPVAGLNTGRIDMLQAGFNLLHPLVGAITTGAALGITAGGALSLAGGGYVEMNTSTLQMINTTSGNKNTTIQAGFLTVDPDIAPTSSIKLFNTLGGGVEIDGGGQGSLKGFSTVQGSNLSSINLDVSTINGVDWQDISGGVFTTVSTFNRLFTSSIQVSSIVRGGFAGQREIIVDGNGFNFKNADPSFNTRYLSSLQDIFSPGINLNIQASTMSLTYLGGINPNGNIRVGAGGAYDAWFYNPSFTTFSTPMLQAQSTIVSESVVSTIGAVGGLPIKVKNVLEFVNPTGIDNCTSINFSAQDNIQQFNFYASTINFAANNTTIQSLSTVRHSTSGLTFSTATSVGSNAAYNYPLYIEYDQAGNLSTGGVAIAVQGHNFGFGAVRNQIEMGARGNGENYIMSVWPGQNLEDLFIDATTLTIRDSDGFSTIVNGNPWGLQTNGQASFGVGSGLVEISSGLIKVGGQTNLTPTTISTTFMNTPYGNNLYYAGLRQPCFQCGSVATSGGSGNQQVQIATPYYSDSNYTVQVTMRDTNTAQMAAVPNSQSSFTVYWSNGGGGSHNIDWLTCGNIPFTG
jgi:hypothetical protein